MSKILLNVLRGSIQRTLRNEALKSSICSPQLGLQSVPVTFCSKSELINKPPSQKKTKEVVKVTLIQQNQNVSVTSLEEAQKLARRRDLKLIKVQDLDPKSQRPVYRLATTAELLSEDFEESKPEKSSTTPQSKKSEKSLTIGSRISDNDLASRLKNITKWLTKGSEVRVLIQGVNDDGKNSENILQKIDSAIKEPEVIGKITQKRSKDNFIKFTIVPVLRKETESKKA